MASSSRRKELMVEDLPDDVLERVLVLAGQQYYPAIVGVSKRWWRVCWGSRQLWRSLNLRSGQSGPPIASYPAAAGAAPAAAADQDPMMWMAEWGKKHQQRLAGWQAAKRAQLERVGRLAEAVTYDDWMGQLAPVSAMLPMLSPEALADLALYVPTITAVEAPLLAGLTGLTRLTLHTPQGGTSAWPVLQQLPRLQHLYLGASRMGAQLIDALLPLTGLTRLDLSAAYLPSLLRLTSLQQLRTFWIDVWDRDWPSDNATQLPVPASFAALQSYRASAAAVYGGLQLAGFRLQEVTFEPLHNAAGGQPAERNTQERPIADQPGSLLIDGFPVAVQPMVNAGGEADEDQEAPADPEQPLPPLNALLKAAVPPSHTLQQLVLFSCCLDTVSLQQLPALLRLHSLEVWQCWSTDGMDAPLQTLVQQAPALTSLLFDVEWATLYPRANCRLHAWPAQLLAHPTLRSLTLTNKGQAYWDADQPLLPQTSAAAVEPVLEHLATDCFPGVPPQLAALTSLRSLDFSGTPQFELTAGSIYTLMALPRLTSLCLPQLSEAGQQVVERLRRAQPGLTISLSAL